MERRQMSSRAINYTTVRLTGVKESPALSRVGDKLGLKEGQLQVWIKLQVDEKDGDSDGEEHERMGQV